MVKPKTGKTQRGLGCWCVGERMREKEADFVEAMI